MKKLLTRHTLAQALSNKKFVLILAVLLSSCGQAPTDSTADIASLQFQVAELQAREAIRTLFTDYGRTLDNRDFEAFGALYAQDSEYVGGGASGTAHGPAEIAALLKRLITGGNATGANLHVYANEKIEIGPDNQSASATSRGAFYVQNATGQPQPLIYATYTDEFVVEDGHWRFKRRAVQGDIPGPSNEERAGIAVPAASDAEPAVSP